MKKIVAFLYVLYVMLFFLWYSIFKQLKYQEEISRAYPGLALNSRINKMRRNLATKNHKTSRKKFIKHMKKQGNVKTITDYY